MIVKPYGMTMFNMQSICVESPADGGSRDGYSRISTESNDIIVAKH